MKMNCVIVVGLLLLSGCGPEPNIVMERRTDPVSESKSNPKPNPVSDTRIKVTLVGVFHDELSYGGKRGIYLIYDQETGSEYIGVSGIGISEVGSHVNVIGKVVIPAQHEE